MSRSWHHSLSIRTFEHHYPKLEFVQGYKPPQNVKIDNGGYDQLYLLRFSGGFEVEMKDLPDEKRWLSVSIAALQNFDCNQNLI